MKFINILKISLMIYLCISNIAINCIQETRISREKYRLIKKAQQKIHKKISRAKFHLTQQQRQYLKKIFVLGDNVKALVESPAINKKLSELKKLMEPTGSGQTLTPSSATDAQLQAKLKEASDLYPSASAKDKANQDTVLNSYRSLIANFLNQKNLEKKKADNAKIADKDDKLEKQTSEGQEEKASVTQDLQALKKLQLLVKKAREDNKAKIANFKADVNNAIQEALPEKFCWRRTGALPNGEKDCGGGVRATGGCPCDYPERSMALCYKSCKQVLDEKKAAGKWPSWTKLEFEKDWANVCYEKCPTGTTDPKKCRTKGPFIKYNDGWWWEAKASFIPDSITNFNKGVSCGDPKVWKKVAAHCVPINNQDCPNTGYQNCLTPLSCAVDKTYCAQAITNMVLGTCSGLLKLFLLIALPGSAQALQIIGWVIQGITAINTAISAMIDMRDLMLAVKKSDILRRSTVKKAQDILKLTQADFIAEKKLTSAEVDTIVESVYIAQENYLEKNKASLTKESVAAKLKEIEKKAGTKFDGKDAVDNKNSNLDDVAKATAISVISQQYANLMGNIIADKIKDTIFENGSFQALFDVNSWFDIYSTFMNAKKLKEKKQTITELQKKTNPSINVESVLNADKEMLAVSQSLVGVIADFEPTGLATIAKAFMYNQCPVYDPVKVNALPKLSVRRRHRHRFYKRKSL